MIFIDATTLPRPASPARAALGFDRWREMVTARDDKIIVGIAEDERGRALLESVFGNSPYLSQLLLREADILGELVVHGPDQVFADLILGMNAAQGEETSTDRLMTGLRRCKGRAALLIAIADIAGLWPIDTVTRALSDFAEASLQLAVRNQLRQLAATGAITLASTQEPERGSGYTVLALGKLGAQELNYSSDIDLMVLYDAEKLRSPEPDALPQQMVRLTRMLMRVMDERTADGYVFRTDLRLRPDPGTTPLAVPVRAAETYYESVGQNWERAAMIRARPVAGDIRMGEEFLQHLRPFMWRKHLDFAAIQDIHSIKRQITAYRGGAAIAVNGHNIKLGRGGIREIEFFAQTQQLIWGGRYPELRTRRVCDTLYALAQQGRVELAVAQEMAECYRYLRRLEHRLQMIDDRQTHEVPRSDEQIEHVAAFMGCPDDATFREELLETLGRVEKHYAELFEEAPDLGGKGTLVFTGTENHPETVATLEEMGFGDGGSVSNVIRKWHHGRYRATRSVRARELLTELMPRLLEAFAHRTDPNAAFARFDAFLAGLPAGVQLFSLFYSHPHLLDLVAEIMGDAPQLADWLSRNPRLLDNVLSDDFYEPIENLAELENDLAATLTQANDFQDVLEVSRRWTNDRKFQVGVQLLHGVSDGHVTGPVLSHIAESVVRALLPSVSAEFAGPGGDHGAVLGGEIAVIAFGKLGGRELMPDSDLDLCFVYDVPPEVEASDGAKPLVPSVYYNRLSQRMEGALEALTGEGRLYQVDTRLRPAGSKGPIASRFEGYARYYDESAWTWEHMALTRARVIAGGPGLAARLTETIRRILERRRDPDQLVVDVAAMRKRMAREHRGRSLWDIKHHRGGMVDIEFVAQYLQLLHAAEHPEILSTNAVEALGKLRDAALLDPDCANDMAEALRFWYRIQSILRITTADGLDGERGPEGPRRALLRAAGEESFPALTARMDETYRRMHGLFDRLIEAPAEKARARVPPKREKEPRSGRG